MNNEATLHGMARIFVNNRIPVFPIYNVEILDGRTCCSCRTGADCKSPGKHPVWDQWQSYASIDPTIVDNVWGRKPWNIGIVTGAQSRLVVVDVDPDHGGGETLMRLEREHGLLPPTPRFLTGGGGEHILFAHPGIRIANSAGKLGSGVDIRGDGGYIVAPPSSHISGRQYAISVDHHPADVPFAPLPDWIITAAGMRQADSNAVQARDWSNFARSKISEGQRNDGLASLAGLLFRRLSYHPRLVAELVLSWNQSHCDPPLEEHEVVTIIDSIARREIERVKGKQHA